MVVCTAALIWAANAKAETKLDKVTVMVCTKPEAVSSIFALHEGVEDNSQERLMTEINMVNQKLGPDTCAFKTIVEEDADHVSTFTFKNESFDVVKVKVWGECIGQSCVYMQYPDEYIAEQTPGRPA